MRKDQPSEISLHNTRLFPKHQGAAAYRLTGIAARCDWVIMTDAKKADALIRGELTHQPRSVFLSLRSIFGAIPYFYEEVLPKIESNFVLITGSEDITIPKQIDARWRPFSASERGLIERIINDERVIHWFAENRDEILPKMSTLPVGQVFENSSHCRVTIKQPELEVKERTLKVLCAHRVRQGEQWEVRRNLTNLCKQRFQEFSTIFTEEISEAAFQQQVLQHPFVLCAQGGGLDPSPKVWFSIANGSIPIIKSSVLDDAYSQLPVVIVDDWNEDCLSLEKLDRWVEEFAPYYDNDQLWAQTLHKLSLDYWWNKISEKLS